MSQILIEISNNRNQNVARSGPEFSRPALTSGRVLSKTATTEGGDSRECSRVTFAIAMSGIALASNFPQCAAQQVNGVLGSPGATTTIDGRQLPPPDPNFGGVIKQREPESTPRWALRVVPPKGAPNVLLIMTDDAGCNAPATFGGVVPTQVWIKSPMPACVIRTSTQPRCVRRHPRNTTTTCRNSSHSRMDTSALGGPIKNCPCAPAVRTIREEEGYRTDVFQNKLTSVLSNFMPAAVCTNRKSAITDGSGLCCGRGHE